jgi:hypothetical protein
MGMGKEFITELEATIAKAVGRLVGHSVVNNHFTKLKKDRDALSSNDCKVLTENVINAVSLFVTKEEAGIVQVELDRLYKAHFPV